MGYTRRATEAVGRTVSTGLDNLALRLYIDHYSDLAARAHKNTHRKPKIP